MTVTVTIYGRHLPVAIYFICDTVSRPPQVSILPHGANTVLGLFCV